MERTITELGICDSFNSALTPYLTPEFFTKNQLPKKLPIFEINYLDANTFLMINDLESSDVSFGDTLFITHFNSSQLDVLFEKDLFPRTV